MQQAWQRLLTAVFLTLLCTAPALAAPVALFDQGHGERFRIDGYAPLDLSQLAAAFTGAGVSVRTGEEPFSEQALTGVDILVVSGPFKPLAAAEIDAVDRFLARGGRLLLTLHVAPTAAGLLERLGLAHSNGVIRDAAPVPGGTPVDFRVSRFAAHPVTAGLEGFNLYGCWALAVEPGKGIAIATTSPHAWVDLNRDKQLGQGDAVQAFAVAVAGERGPGRFVVFGDDTLFQNQFLTGDNRTLANNLVKWLQP